MTSLATFPEVRMSGSTRAHRPKTTFDLVQPEVVKDPAEFLSKLRNECPVAHTDDLGGFWMLSRYEDVYRAARNVSAFSSASGVTIPPQPNPPALCLEQDEPDHARYRLPIQPWFSPGRTAQLEPAVRRIVTSVIDDIIDDRQANLAAAIAEPVPPMVIAGVLGLPDAEWPWFREQNESYLRASIAGDGEAAVAHVNELVGYLARTLAERRAHPREDMLTDIVRMEVDDKPLSEDEAVSLAFLLLAAGHETTVGAIGGMLYRVARDREVRDRLLAEPGLVHSAVEESLRLELPLMGLGRMITADTTVRDVVMPAGERAMLMFGAANRDPAVFADPEEFRVDRPNNRHLAFGTGVHRCVGAPLARLEMSVVLEEVLARMPDLELVSEDDVEVRYQFSRSYTTLTARW